MTTEIYRNMLLAEDSITNDLQAVVFDEIHYLGDRERGTVWEEAIIFSPDHVRFLCLSATIPNAKQFASWIQSVQDHPVRVVTETKRAVPLEHQCYDNRFGFSSVEEMEQRQKQGKYPRGKKRRPPTLTHRNLVQELDHKNRLPCIYFCFSRKTTEEYAGQHHHSFLTKAEQEKMRALLDEAVEDMEIAIARLKTTKLLIRCLRNGVAFHHAGLLPRLKELVEDAFAANLIGVLYATETFAVGINLPAKSVCFASLEKYDGIEFRYLESREYFQMGGRAGRRGMDKVGYVISYLDGEYADFGTIKNIFSSKSEPLTSQYALSYNTVLNLIANHNQREREIILQSSFYTYQQPGKKRERVLKEYRKMASQLRELEYLHDDGLTEKGEFARKIYQEELIITELFTSTLVEEYDELDIILLIGALEFEPRHNIKFRKGHAPHARQLMEAFKPYREIFQYFKKTAIYKLEPLVTRWYEGGEFADLLELTTLSEGDIIRFFRRIIDVGQQIRKATTDDALRDTITNCIRAIDRDVVEVRL